jgi:chromosome segregation ATPase
LEINKNKGVTMDREIEQAFHSVETLIKNNYTNLDIRIQKLETDIKEDIEKLDKSIINIQKDWKYDHDKLLQLEGKIHSQKENFEFFQKQEKLYGIKTDQKISDAEKKIETVETLLQRINISYGKIIGIVIGVGLVLAVVYKVAGLFIK